MHPLTSRKLRQVFLLDPPLDSTFILYFVALLCGWTTLRWNITLPKIQARRKSKDRMANISSSYWNSTFPRFFLFRYFFKMAKFLSTHRFLERATKARKIISLKNATRRTGKHKKLHRSERKTEKVGFFLFFEISIFNVSFLDFLIP